MELQKYLSCKMFLTTFGFCLINHSCNLLMNTNYDISNTPVVT